MPKNRRLLENRGNNEYNVLLPEIISTPRGNYTNYSGNETFIPNYEVFKNEELNKSRINAVNKMVQLYEPAVPKIPSRNFLSVMLGKFGVSDETREKIFGIEEAPYTCIYTATSQFDDEDAKVTGNKTFSDNPNKYGFTKVSKNNIKPGDLSQYYDVLGRPHHIAMVTGFDKNGQPVFSYSNGNYVPYDVLDEDTIYTIKKDKELDFMTDELGEADYYRYIGTPSKLSNMSRKYNNMYRNRLRNRGIEFK